MNNLDFKILENNINDSIIVDDYITCEKSLRYKSSKAFYGITLASMIICSTHKLEAKNYEKNILFDWNQKSIESVIKQNDDFDIYVNKLSDLTKSNFRKNDVVEQIVSFRALNENWDGYGALPLEVKSAANALNVVNNFNDFLISKISEIYPNPHGTITFEFENDFDEKLLLEIGNDRFTYFLKLNSMDVKFFDNLEFIDENINVLRENIQSI